jgi:hypothetical protein
LIINFSFLIILAINILSFVVKMLPFIFNMWSLVVNPLFFVVLYHYFVIFSSSFIVFCCFCHFLSLSFFIINPPPFFCHLPWSSQCFFFVVEKPNQDILEPPWPTLSFFFVGHFLGH